MTRQYDTDLTHTHQQLDALYLKFKQGVQLPYDILDIHNIADGAKAGNFIEIRCGGFGSEISPHPTEKNQFYALTDRGPTRLMM